MKVKGESMKLSEFDSRYMKQFIKTCTLIVTSKHRGNCLGYSTRCCPEKCPLRKCYCDGINIKRNAQEFLNLVNMKLRSITIHEIIFYENELKGD